MGVLDVLVVYRGCTRRTSIMPWVYSTYLYYAVGVLDVLVCRGCTRRTCVLRVYFTYFQYAALVLRVCQGLSFLGRTHRSLGALDVFRV